MLHFMKTKIYICREFSETLNYKSARGGNKNKEYTKHPANILKYDTIIKTTWEGTIKNSEDEGEQIRYFHKTSSVATLGSIFLPTLPHDSLQIGLS